MTQTRTKKDVDLFWQRLEVERHDLSYKRPAEPVFTTQPQIIVRTVKETPKDREKRDKLMFNAGRYAAGARDNTALTAHAALEAELAEGKKK
jgi:hypothetical protein